MTSLSGWPAIMECISATRSVSVDGLVISWLLPLAVLIGRRTTRVTPRTTRASRCRDFFTRTRA
jgi:hypothetical protein